MPVSPRDFELYSRMTGTPMPSDAMSRMQMAPAVYDFTKNFARKPNLLEKTGNLIKSAGRNTLVGAGLLAGMDLENQERQSQELLRNEIAKDDAVEVTMSDSPEQVTSEPMTAGERQIDKKMKMLERQAELEQQARDDKQTKAKELLQIKKQDLVDTPIKGSYTRTRMIKTDPPQYEEEVIDPFAQQATTADNYQQDFVPNQTSSGLIDRKMEQGSQIADETPNVAEVLSESQDSRQSEFANPEDVQKQMESDMIGGGLGKNQLSKFLEQKGINQALLGAIGDRTTEEPLIGDNSPLLDHPDIIGGEDDSNLPSGTNTGATQDLSDHHKEMRKMDALERMAEQSPSTKQIALNEMNKSREGFMAQDGPNKPAYDAKQRILKKTAEKRKEIEKTKGPSIVFMNAGSGESKEVPISDVNSLEDVKNMTKEVMSPSVSQKSDDFMAKFVEGARSDIVRGQRGNQSLGITRIPATNGDSQVGFVLANRPLDQSPSTATTYGFGVAPGAEDIIKGSLDANTFDTYMDRGMKEARQGKKRKAGEIFEFLAPKARIVQGRANLGDIVM